MRPVGATDREGRDPRFPPMVRFNVFLDGIQELTETAPVQRPQVLDDLPENDRSQLRRALELFGIRTENGRYDEIALRRLADRERRPSALTALLQEHYGPELEAIQAGIRRDDLEEMLAVPGRGSPSSREKARQFLERAMEEAGHPTNTIQQATGRDTHGPQEVQAAQEPRNAGELRFRFIEQQQEYLDELLTRHERASDSDEARRLEGQIDSVSERIARLLGEL